MYISHSEELKNYVYICLKCVQCNTVAQISFCFESTSPQVCSTTTTTTTTTTTRRRTSNKQQPSHHPLSPPPQKKTATCYMFKLHRRHCSRTGMQAASAICFCTWLRFWWSRDPTKGRQKKVPGFITAPSTTSSCYLGRQFKNHSSTVYTCIYCICINY